PSGGPMPTSPDDLIALLGSALDQAGELIAATTPEQAGRPTPCRSFDLRALVNHTVHDVKQFTRMAAGDRYDRGESDLIGDDSAAPVYDRLAGVFGRDPGVR